MPAGERTVGKDLVVTAQPDKARRPDQPGKLILLPTNLSHTRMPGRRADSVVPVCKALTVPDRTWVSKTNVTSYLRCPYAFWLTDSGQLDRAELLSPFEAQLAETGIAFERGIVEAATPIEMPPGGEAELFADDHTILQVRAFRNPELRLDRQAGWSRDGARRSPASGDQGA